MKKFDAAFPTTMLRGMTLRDWFAGQALAGLMAAHGSSNFTSVVERDEARRQISVVAFIMADAMMSAGK